MKIKENKTIILQILLRKVRKNPLNNIKSSKKFDIAHGLAKTLI